MLRGLPRGILLGRPMRLYLNRFLGAAMLDVKLYQEVAAEPRFLNQAWITVLIYAMLASWGSFGRAGAIGSNIGLVTAVIGWYVWAFSTYYCAVKWFREAPAGVERGDRKTVMRVMGFACAPGAIRLLGLLPGMGILALVVSSVWMIAAATVGLKTAFHFESTARAAGACIIGWIIGAIAQGLLLVTLFQVFGAS
jgi:hypothetical protein